VPVRGEWRRPWVRVKLKAGTVKATFNTPCEQLGLLSGEEEAARGCCTKVGGTGKYFPGEGVENSMVDVSRCLSSLRKVCVLRAVTLIIFISPEMVVRLHINAKFWTPHFG